MPEATVLVVEDEPVVSEVVARYLQREGFVVRVSADGNAAIAMAREQEPDLVLLDLMLPKMDGLSVLKTLRLRSSVPIVILTAKGEETDRVVGLELGADDYVSKPFSPRELVARVKAVLRRSKPGAIGGVSPPIRAGEIVIEPATRQVTVAEQLIELTAKEFDLLWFLARNAGQVFTRSQLLDKVWDYQFDGEASTVTVHIHRLRTKIEGEPLRPRHLKTVWGVGYKFEV